MLQWFRKKLNNFLILYCLASIFTLLACQAADPGGKNSAQEILQDINNTTIAVTFGPDGRLWRLIPTSDSVYLDYSDNNGVTFSKPVQVNNTSQKINVWPENPPAIVISQSGRIHILYYANAAQKATSYFSYSDDGGRTFSDPVMVSDHAQTDMHYMDTLLVDKNNKIYLFWHDMRHEQHNQDLGSGVLSLYYSTTDKPNGAKFINHKVSDGICSCCRTATDFSPQQLPVVFARAVFNDGARDHALVSMSTKGEWSAMQRVTHDDWLIEACPEHGPALSIDALGRSHFAWFTLGNKRQGIFYANSDDYGASISAPMQLGDKQRLPSHPDVLSVGNHVLLAWKEFDGNISRIIIKESHDRGRTWQQQKPILSSAAASGHPALISNGKQIFLSWINQDHGHQFLEIN